MTVATLQKRTDTAKPEAQSPTPGAVPSPAALSDLESTISGALGTSVLEIDQLIAHLGNVRDRLQQEGQRVHRELSQYAQLSRDVREIATIMTESLSELRNKPR
jgi:hypothetical protein